MFQRLFKDEIEVKLNTIPSAVVSASCANAVGGVPDDDDAATADVVVVKLKQLLSPVEKKIDFFLVFIQSDRNQRIDLNGIFFRVTKRKKGCQDFSNLILAKKKLLF